MSPDTESFLDSVRGAEDPARSDQARVLAAVRAAVATGGVVAAGAGASELLKLLAAFGTSGAKGGALVLCLVAAAGLADPRPHPAPPTRASVALGGRSAAKPSAGEIGPAAPEIAPPPAPEVTPPPAPVASPVPPPADPPPATPANDRHPLRPPSLQAELALLTEAQAAIRRGDGTAAIRLLDSHATTDTQMAAERRAARILALCVAGREPEARRAAADFLRENAGSVHEDAIARSCAGDGSRGPR